MKRWTIALAGIVGSAALLLPMLSAPTARIVYNRSDSVPRGWYRIVQPVDLHAGSLVLVRLPQSASALAAQRGYLPSGVPLLKRVGAKAPQHVCVRRQTVRVDGVMVARVLAADGRGRQLHAWRGCRALRSDELFLLSVSNPASFDSRHFGPVPGSAVFGQALPLWTWEVR